MTFHQISVVWHYIFVKFQSTLLTFGFAFGTLERWLLNFSFICADSKFWSFKLCDGESSKSQYCSYLSLTNFLFLLDSSCLCSFSFISMVHCLSLYLTHFFIVLSPLHSSVSFQYKLREYHPLFSSPKRHFRFEGDRDRRLLVADILVAVSWQYLKTFLHCHGHPEAVFLVVCDPPMNELWVT